MKAFVIGSALFALGLFGALMLYWSPQAGPQFAWRMFASGLGFICTAALMFCSIKPAKPAPVRRSA